MGRSAGIKWEGNGWIVEYVFLDERIREAILSMVVRGKKPSAGAEEVEIEEYRGQDYCE